MDEKTLYIVEVHGVVRVEASSDADAKEKALTHFGETPQAYLRILGTVTVLVES